MIYNDHGTFLGGKNMRELFERIKDARTELHLSQEYEFPYSL